ncbi:type II toxin-antitoxin system HicB family antitoxin [Bartonella sp. DGB2]|uniref:type II toxin-antitoxin system HicB family antitoxin n=1 Tax=Bartonella sp. DGB2 TaxID=3388426 RepID=UPI00398FF916
MRRYYALVYKDKDSSFGIEFPDLQGVFSASDTEEELIANAIEALQLFLEDFTSPPAATCFDELLKRDEIKQALSEGAFLLQVPYIENDTAVVRANISIEKGLLKAIDASAKERGLTRSSFLAAAARHELNM